MDYKLKNDKFLKIYSENGVFYGGDQDWFLLKRQKLNGCGPIAITNSIIYILKMADEKLTKEEYIELATEIYIILNPSPIGLLSFNKIIDRVLSLNKRFNINLGYRVIKFNNNYYEYLEFIKSGLALDLPVLSLNLNFNFRKSFYWHWVSITGLFEDKDGVKISVSSWGRRYILDFNEYFKSLMPGSGMIYFYRR